MEQKIDWADLFQRFTTKTLWHFTGRNKPKEEAYNTLISILKSRTLKISNKISSVKMPNGEHRQGYKCSCMCDIPFKDLRIHTIRYGWFGIAFHKPNAIGKGHFNPVLYVHNNHFLFKHAEKLLKRIDTHNMSSALDKDLSEYLTLLGTYVKVSDLLNNLSLEATTDEEQKNNFYYERKWRSAYDWNFDENDVAAIMMPKQFIEDFKKQLCNQFNNVSIIAAEMILVL